MRLALVLALSFVLTGGRPQTIDGLGDLNRLGYAVEYRDPYWIFQRENYGQFCAGRLALNWESAVMICANGAVVDAPALQVLRRQVCYRNLCNASTRMWGGLYVWAVVADHGILASTMRDYDQEEGQAEAR